MDPLEIIEAEINMTAIATMGLQVRDTDELFTVADPQQMSSICEPRQVTSAQLWSCKLSEPCDKFVAKHVDNNCLSVLEFLI